MQVSNLLNLKAVQICTTPFLQQATAARSLASGGLPASHANLPMHTCWTASWVERPKAPLLRTGLAKPCQPRLTAAAQPVDRV